MANFRIHVLALAAALAIPVPAVAQDAATPYWSSIRSTEVNMRVGPGEDYRILWVYHRPMLPMKVLRVKEGWRYVRDPDGAEGWVLARFLTRERTGFVTKGAPAPLREEGARLPPACSGRLRLAWSASWATAAVAGASSPLDHAKALSSRPGCGGRGNPEAPPSVPVQASSMAIAVASPPPMQSAATPRFLP